MWNYYASIKQFFILPYFNSKKNGAIDTNNEKLMELRQDKQNVMPLFDWSIYINMSVLKARIQVKKP